MILKIGDTFFSESKWMMRKFHAKLLDFSEPAYPRLADSNPQFVFLRPGFKGYFQKGQKRYFCEVVRFAGYAMRHLRVREYKFTYEVKVIE